MSNTVANPLSLPPNLLKLPSIVPSNAHLLFAHGAGAGSQHPFMLSLAEALNVSGVHVWLFDFAYMAQAKAEGKRRPPPRLPKLEVEYLNAIAYVQAQIGTDSLWIGGKSMGGRVACHALNTLTLAEPNSNSPKPIIGATIIGYPFHPVGKPESLRLAVLQSSTLPVLICQGERDTFGTREEIATYACPDNIQIMYFNDGDHSLKPRKASGLSQEQHILAAAKVIAGVIKQSDDSYDASI
ncbi:MAG: alpha/beta fold hydrolase [Glaciecola sp.]|nr:alpha/beta fold hydrolase [Glaciecola sp.]